MEHHTNQRFVPKLSTSKSNQRAHMKHHKVQSETTNGAPERFCQNGGPASPIREQEAPQSRIKDHKRRSKKSAKKNFRHFHLETVLIGQVTQLSQYYFAPQRWHKALPSTYFLLHKALLRTFSITKLAQPTSQQYFLQQSVKKLFLSSTLCYKFAQITSQFYFVVQSLHKARSITSML